MGNNPLVEEVSGNRAYVTVFNSGGTTVDYGITANTIRHEAGLWLKERGYVMEEAPYKANVVIQFRPLQEEKNIVNGSPTYVLSTGLPAAGSPGTSKPSLDALAAAAGGQLVFKKGDLDEKNSKQRKVLLTGLALSITKQEHNKSDEVVTTGGVGPEEVNQNLFTDEYQLRAAVKRALEDSKLGDLRIATQASSVRDEDPGCKYRVGVRFFEKAERGGTAAYVESFEKGSMGEKAGLKRGDRVLELDHRRPGSPMREFMPGELVQIRVLRNGNEVEAEIPVALICNDIH